MSQSTQELQVSGDSHAAVKYRFSYVSVALNVGLAIFVADGFWQLLHGPFATSAEHTLHTLFFYSGICLASVMWIVSSQNAGWLKGAMAFAVVGGILFTAIESISQFHVRERELMRGTVVNGRVVYPGLGLSFASPQNWILNLQPFIQKSKSRAGNRVPAACIQYGELAVFFQAYPPADPANVERVADSIQLEGGPFIFRSLGRTLGSIRQMESSYRRMSGVRIVRPMRFYQINGTDIAEFDLVDESLHVYYRHVFVRCGENRLDFVLATSGEQAPDRFDDFIHSIHITRQPSRFSD